MAVVLGTAGHIDHGKTSLVRALTGMDCDRLEEEKRRGITIELGFAWLNLPDSGRLGIVDVPGHERFVRNMVAGAAGVDCVMLVVAADEGVMPQTREHLEICTLLGIRNGLVALTKTDMADTDWLAMVCEDLARFLEGSFLEGAPVFPVSAQTGEGVDALRAHLIRLAAELPDRRRSDIFRLPADRVFSMKGYGTVVTGTVVSGLCRAGDALCVMPAGLPARARTLQHHGTSVQEVRPGQRCAVNVQGLEVAQVERGQVLAHPGTLLPSDRWLVNLACLSSAPRPLRQRTEIHFHHGTRECLARVVFPDRDKLAPGEEALAELRFREPLVGIFGDHCVLRAYSPLRTVAGGSLVSPLPPQLRRKDPQRERKLEVLRGLTALRDAADAPGDGKAGNKNRDQARAALLEAVLEVQAGHGADEAHLRVLTGLARPALESGLHLLSTCGAALCWDKENRAWIGKKAFEQLAAACLDRARELHRRSPLASAFSRGALCTGWSNSLPQRLAQKILDHLLKSGELAAEGDGLRVSSHRVSLAADQTAVRQKLLDVHAAAGLAPPNIGDVLAELHISPREAAPVLRLLVRERLLVCVREGMYYHGPALEDILERVRLWFQSHDNLDVASLKDILGLSRKYLIALLEYMDNEHITVRVGDQRRYRGR